MAVMEKPLVKALSNGGKCWQQGYDKFRVKAYVPATDIDGQVHNYGFRAPLLLIFEEKEMTMDEAVAFAEEKGLAKIASAVDSSVLFVYPTCDGGWDNANEDLYKDLIAEIKMNTDYEDGIAKITDFFKREFKGYFIRGAIFRADIYSYGKSADYCAKNLLKKIDGEYLWGPGEITPAMVSMENLSVVPDVQRKDIAVLSVGNSDAVNKAFEGCENLLIKDKAEYEKDFKAFVRKFKMWCGKIEIEPDFEALDMTEKAEMCVVNTSEKNMRYKDPTHKVGYFAYYNNDTFKNGPAPLVVGFHGGGDSSMYLTFVAGWWEVCHKNGFLFVSLENHQDVPASEAIQVVEDIKKKYNVDVKRIYATGFSMGSGKTWDMFHEYPEVFAGLMPASALFPVKNNPFGLSYDDPRMNKTVSVPMFYSGGEESHLVELPKQGESGLERIQYLASVNKIVKKFDVKFEDKDSWENPIYGIYGDEVEKVPDESRGSTLTINYFKSEDGVVRTALASISGQVHECRQHTCENAWKFISKFSLDNK